MMPGSASIRFIFTAAVVAGAIVLSSFQEGEFRLNNSLSFSHATMTTDPLGNAYIIAENQLFQFDSTGKPKANFADPSAGMLTTVDATNPMKLLLFYREFAQLQLLNNKLSVQSVINLRNLGIIQPLAACQSALDGYWVFDYQDFSLKKIDLNLQLVNQSGDMSQTLGYPLFPKQMVESDNSVYLNNPATGILVFDKFASYLKTIPISGIQSFQIVGKDLLYVKDNRLQRFNFTALSENEVILPQHDSLVNVRYEQRQLFLLTTTALHFYSY